MKRDSYSDQHAHASFQPRSPQSADDSTQLSQPVHHSSSSNELGAKWLNKASRWVADKFQTAQNLMGSGEAIASDQILPALRGTATPSQSAQSDQPLVGVIDSGFGANEHGSKMVEAIQQENPQAKIWRGGGVGAGGGLEALVEFVDVAKATGQTRAVANLSFDLTEVHPDGSISTRTQLTAKEQSALAYARDNGVLVVASAGNQGGAMSALGQASQPFDNLIVVGAANGSDRASYSSYGKGLDLVADVGTAGTSLAAAKTTGAIAKLWSDNPELSSQQVNQMLTATATDLKAPGWDAETGAGLLNSGEAIELAKHTTPEPIVFSGAQLVRQNSGLNEASSFKSRAWTSTDGAIASERPNLDLFDGITATVRKIAGIAEDKLPTPTPFERHREMERAPLPPQPISAQQAFERHREMERAPLSPQPTSAHRTAPEPNPPDSAAMEQPNSTPGQVAIQQGDTLWDIAQAKLGSGDRWRELRKANGSPFTEQEASQLQVGTSVQIPGAQPEPIPTPPPDPAFALHRQMERDPLPPPPPPPPPAPEPNHVADFFSSVGNKLWEAGEGVIETVTNPGQAVTDLVNSVHTIVTDPGQAWDSFSKPYLDALSSGRIGDFFGQIAGDALLAVSPGGLAARIGNGLRRIDAAPPAPTPEIPSPSSALPESPPATIPSPSSALPEPLPVRTPSSSPTLSEPTPPPAPNPTDLTPPAPAPDSIASIPDDVGNALREMGDGETLNNPPPSVPPAPQSASLGIDDNLTPPNSLTDGSGSPSSSGSELADPNVSRPSAVDPDRQLVTVGARDLDQASSSPDRSTADSRNYEPAAVGGGNGGTRPSDPPTVVPIPSATTRSDRADSPPAPQSGGSGGGNQPPQDPPIGGGGSPSSSDSEPDDPNKPSGTTNGTSDNTPPGLYRDSKGRLRDQKTNEFVSDPNKPQDSGERQRDIAAAKKFMKEQLNTILAAGGSHPLQFLIDPATRDWLYRDAPIQNRPAPVSEEEIEKEMLGVQTGHTTSFHGLEAHEPERFAVEDAYNNNWSSRWEGEGEIHLKKAIDIDGVIVEKMSALYWEKLGKLPKGTVDSAPEVEGWVSPNWTPPAT